MIFNQTNNQGACCSINVNSNGHDCCTPQPKGKTECPKCSEKAKGVLGKTLEHLLTDKAKSQLACFDGFYFCKTASCEVVYFRNKEVLTQKDINIAVGHKNGASPAASRSWFILIKSSLCMMTSPLTHSLMSPPRKEIL